MTEFEMKLNQVTQAVRRGKLSRRDFMSYAMSIGITAAAANTMFATAARAEPKKGGTFKSGHGHGSTTDSLDPATWTNGFNFQFGKSVIWRAADPAQSQGRSDHACCRVIRTIGWRQEVGHQAAQGHYLP